VKAISTVFEPTQPSIHKWISNYESVERALWTLRGLDEPRRPFIGSLQGRKMRSRHGAFDQFGALFQFPSYFGNNWNAFRDCIADLDWLRADAFFLVILDAEQLLIEGEADELGLLLEILRDAAESMSQVTSLGPPKPFRVFLQATSMHGAELEARLRGVQTALVNAEIDGASWPHHHTGAGTDS
jgi:hypothetical protein